MVAPVAAHVCAAGSSTVGGAVAAALHFFAVAQCMLREPWPEQPLVLNESHFDFVVVGGGTAGAVVATRLALLQDVTVLLVEAGGDPPHASVIPGYKDIMKSGPYDWNFTSVSDAQSSTALEGGRQRQPRGRILGGTSSANDMIYTRGFPQDFHEWAEVGGDGWDWDTVLRYYKKTEHLTDKKILNDPVLMQYHSVGGEMQVSGVTNPTKEVEVFLKAFNEIGFHVVDDMTYPKKFGAGRFLHTIRNGQRESSATAFLNKLMDKKKGNLFILRNSLVTKVLVNSNKTAFGITVMRENMTQTYYADLEVILSAGTFNTPKLLMLSGIGPKQHLEEMGIDVVQDLPVGEKLHDHAMVLNYLAADTDMCSTTKPEEYMDLIRYLFDRSGSLADSDSMGVYVSLKDSTDRSVPDFAIYPVCIPKDSDFHEACSTVLNFKKHICDKLGAINKQKELLSFAVVFLNPKSRGSVKLMSKDPFVNPKIYSGTFSNSADLEGYPEVMEIVYSIANTSYFQKRGACVVDLDLEECKEVSTKEMLKCRARALVTSAWHSVGTAAIGSVVDAALRVRGVAGLRVVDASVMPKVIRGNTNAPAVMIAERAFDLIREDINYLSYNFLV